MYSTRQRKGIQYTFITCPMGIKTLSTYPTVDIQYPIKSGELTASYKPDIVSNIV